MAGTYKAQRQIIQIGDISLEVAMLPDGSYRLSHSQATEIVDKNRNSMLRFCRSKYLQSFLGNTSGSYTVPEEIFLEGANRPIIPITFELACLFWQKCAAEGNPKARAIVVALLKDSLYTLADEAFGVKSSKEERSHHLTEDVSPKGVARLEAIYQNLSTPESAPQAIETSSFRELQLKVRLAEVELEREKLQHEIGNSFALKNLSKAGVPPWRVISQVQRSMGWSHASAAYKLICQLGYGVESDHWFSVRIGGGISVMSWSSIDSLIQAVEQFKSSQN